MSKKMPSISVGKTDRDPDVEPLRFHDRPEHAVDRLALLVGGRFGALPQQAIHELPPLGFLEHEGIELGSQLGG
jgi:hypothetical protein